MNLENTFELDEPIATQEEELNAFKSIVESSLNITNSPGEAKINLFVSSYPLHSASVHRLIERSDMKKLTKIITQIRESEFNSTLLDVVINRVRELVKKELDIPLKLQNWMVNLKQTLETIVQFDFSKSSDLIESILDLSSDIGPIYNLIRSEYVSLLFREFKKFKSDSSDLKHSKLFSLIGVANSEYSVAMDGELEDLILYINSINPNYTHHFIQKYIQELLYKEHYHKIAVIQEKLYQNFYQYNIKLIEAQILNAFVVVLPNFVLDGKNIDELVPLFTTFRDNDFFNLLSVSAIDIGKKTEYLKSVKERIEDIFQVYNPLATEKSEDILAKLYDTSFEFLGNVHKDSPEQREEFVADIFHWIESHIAELFEIWNKQKEYFSEDYATSSFIILTLNILKHLFLGYYTDFESFINSSMFELFSRLVSITEVKYESNILEPSFNHLFWLMYLSFDYYDQKNLLDFYNTNYMNLDLLYSKSNLRILIRDLFSNFRSPFDKQLKLISSEPFKSFTIRSINDGKFDLASLHYFFGPTLYSNLFSEIPENVRVFLNEIDYDIRITPFINFFLKKLEYNRLEELDDLKDLINWFTDLCKRNPSTLLMLNPILQLRFAEVVDELPLKPKLREEIEGILASVSILISHSNIDLDRVHKRIEEELKSIKLK